MLQTDESKGNFLDDISDDEVPAHEQGNESHTKYYPIEVLYVRDVDFIVVYQKLSELSHEPTDVEEHVINFENASKDVLPTLVCWVLVELKADQSMLKTFVKVLKKLVETYFFASH